MPRIEHFGALDPYRSIAEQTGIELRTVLGLARQGRLQFLYDANGLLRRAPNGNPHTALRRLRDVKNHWLRRDGALVTYCTSCRAGLTHTDLRANRCPDCQTGLGRYDQWRDPLKPARFDQQAGGYYL